MQTAYLINNSIGASSRKVNGLKGDQVTIITYSLNMRLVENESGHKFWVNENNLSQVPIQKEIVYEQANTEIKSRKKRV
jgi:uncharacterized protein YgiM (DUF1202 family)